MGKILILEDVANSVMDSKAERAVLFGKKDYIQSGTTLFDLMFHCIEGVPLERFKEDSLLTIPVLPFFYPEDLTKAEVVMNEVYKGNPHLTTFAIKDRSANVYDCGKEAKGISGIFLRFFDLNKVPIGTEIRSSRGYSVCTEEVCRTSFPNWADIMKHISELKKEINRKYYS